MLLMVQAIALRTVLMVGILLNVMWLMVCWPLVLLELRRRLRWLGGHKLLLCLLAVNAADKWALEGRDLDMITCNRGCGIAAGVGLRLHWFRHRVLHVHLNRATQWISLQHLLMLLLLLLLLLMVLVMQMLLLRDVLLD